MKNRTRATMNRRHFPRTEFFGPVLLDFEADWMHATAIDVSLGGLKVKSDRPIPLDREIDIYFELNGVGIETQAHVAHHDGPIYGLAFNRSGKKSYPPHRYSFSPAA